MPRHFKRRRRPPGDRPRHAVLILWLVLLVALTAITIYLFASPPILPRVLFAETANCTHAERLLVAGVIRNRLKNPAFGNAPTLEAVVRLPGAFSCIDDPHNANWLKSRHPSRLSTADKVVWNDCLQCLADIPEARGPSGRPLVYYHDLSITKPRSWDNARWRAIRELATTHFVFYSITPAHPWLP